MDKKTAISLSHLVTKANIHTLATALEHAPSEEKIQIFKLLSNHKAQKVFNYLEAVNQAEIIKQLDPKKASLILERMEPDDRARLLNELPGEKSEEFLKQISSKERRATKLLLKYPEETAGRIMSPFFIPLKKEFTVEQSIREIREQGEEAETLYMLPVIDDNKRLLGIMELDKLVLSQPNETIADLMSKDFKSFSVYDDQEDIARFIQLTDQLAVSIVDENEQMVGIVTVDDAMDIMQLEETEDIYRSGASEPIRKPYLSVSIFRLMRIRIFWLFLLALAGTLTVQVLGAYEETLNHGIVLALFIPLLIGVGGNTGSQSATIIVRALAMDHIRTKDFLKVAIRETCVGVLMGAALGLAAYIVIALVFKPSIALIVALSMLAICTVAALAGSLMPLLARSLKFDPAVVSAPLVSTIIDATGLFIYLMIAGIVLGL